MVNIHEHSKVLSSLPLQILLYFNSLYDIIYVIINSLIFIYKSQALPYPPTRLGWECSFIFFFVVIEFCRIYLGKLSDD